MIHNLAATSAVYLLPPSALRWETRLAVADSITLICDENNPSPKRSGTTPHLVYSAAFGHKIALLRGSCHLLGVFYPLRRCPRC